MFDKHINNKLFILVVWISIEKSNIVGSLLPWGQGLRPTLKAVIKGKGILPVYTAYTEYGISDLWPASRAGYLTCPKGRISDLPRKVSGLL